MDLGAAPDGGNSQDGADFSAIGADPTHSEECDETLPPLRQTADVVLDKSGPIAEAAAEGITRAITLLQGTETQNENPLAVETTAGVHQSEMDESEVRCFWHHP